MSCSVSLLPHVLYLYLVFALAFTFPCTSRVLFAFLRQHRFPLPRSALPHFLLVSLSKVNLSLLSFRHDCHLSAVHCFWFQLARLLLRSFQPNKKSCQKWEPKKGEEDDVGVRKNGVQAHSQLGPASGVTLDTNARSRWRRLQTLCNTQHVDLENA